MPSVACTWDSDGECDTRHILRGCDKWGYEEYKECKQDDLKRIGISSQIVNLLRDICLGEHYIEIALLLRESMFINSVLTNAEIWFFLKKEEIKQLEDLDKTLLKKILKVPFSTPGEAYFLELGILPLGVIIKACRLN